MRIPKEDNQTWINALRSGNYNQTTETLQNEKGFCCLGVACDLFIPKNIIETRDGYIRGSMPGDQIGAPEWLDGISLDFLERTGRTLTELNDDLGYSFLDIADALETVYIKEEEWTLKTR